MRVAFFGSTYFSCLIFKALWESHHEVVAVVTQPDQPAGRNMELCPTAMCRHVGEVGIPVLKPEKLVNNHEFRKELAALRPDAFMVASYGKIICRKVLALTEYPLNVHPSALPELRGASPVRTTLLQGLRDTECCIMRMTPRLDDGDVLMRAPVAIPRDMNFAGLIELLGTTGGPLAVQALDAVSDGTATFTPQDHDRATHSPRYTRESTVIDWTRPAGELHDFIRAWDPDRGAMTVFADGRRFKVWRARVEDPPGDVVTAQPGVVAAVSRKAAWIGCGEGFLRLLEVQCESKARMPIGSFLAGSQLCPGDRFGE